MISSILAGRVSPNLVVLLHSVLRIVGAAFTTVALGGLVLVACGSPHRAPRACPAFVVPPSHPEISSAAGTAAVESAVRNALTSRLSVTFHFSGASLFGASCTPMSGAGAFDVASGKGELHVATEGVPATSSGSYTMLYSDRGVYVRLPLSETRKLPAGRPWVAATFSPAGPKATQYPEDTRAFFSQVLSPDPRLVLEELALGNTVADAGRPVRWRGGAATAYQVSVDLAVARRGLAGGFAGAFSAVLEASLPATGSTTTSTSTPGVSDPLASTTTSTATNPWLTPTAPPPSSNAYMQVVVGHDGKLDSVTFLPTTAKLGKVTMSFSLLATGVDPDHPRVPGRYQSVDIGSFVKALGGEKGESGGS